MLIEKVEVENKDDINQEVIMMKGKNSLVDMKYITECTKMTDKWFYALIKKGQFPKPIKLGRSSRWWLSDIHDWISSQQEGARHD
ncbi:AlpA family phage regulatory protein [Moellerella wisconsensis]|uniref:helix-turn-helix transcriptional regulator n=2 Tax=Morganellaceae TaxID=1903414 RepID=UPI00307612BF